MHAFYKALPKCSFLRILPPPLNEVVDHIFHNFRDWVLSYYLHNTFGRRAPLQYCHQLYLKNDLQLLNNNHSTNADTTCQ
eukprot:5721752-Amphidinium_carterae.1